MSSLDALRESIRTIERRPPALSGREGYGFSGEYQSPRGDRTAWTLGDALLDDVIGMTGLDLAGVHEVKPAPHLALAGAQASAMSFALSLTVRRLLSLERHRPDAPILLCTTSAQCLEAGAAYAPGLAARGIDPARLILVEVQRRDDALWAIEEGLKSGGLGLVLGRLDDVALTPARRLALASARTATPCLLLTHPRSPPVAATATRWRIAPAPSARHAFDPEAPGAPRLRADLERCRGATVQASSLSYLLEWCDAAYRFGVVPGMADEPARSRPAQRPASSSRSHEGWEHRRRA